MAISTRPKRLLAATLLVLAASHWAYAADAPALLGQFALRAPGTSLSVTPDGSRLLLELNSSPGQVTDLQVIDASDPSHLVERGHVTVSRMGDIALSPDGRRALLAARVVDGGSNKPNTYEVKSLDLSDPSRPRALWTRTVAGGAMALAPDASAFAYAEDTQAVGRRGEVILVRAGGGETRLGLDNVGVFPNLQVSPGARFVAIDDLGWTVEDLAKNPPNRFQRTRTSFQQDACVMAILSSGHVLAQDTRAPRFGVYAPEGNLPRIAKVTHGAGAGSSCSFGIVGRAGHLLLLQDANGTLYPLDMSDVRHPRLSKPLVLPPGSVASGMDAKGRIYALKAVHGENRLEIYGMARTAPPTVDWHALERVRAEALKIYGNRTLPDDQRKSESVRKFEDAGTFAALSARVTGVSNSTAAAILNDYAFLLQRSRPPGDADVRALLRRSIELDPDRRVAYLNLAEALRQSLESESDPRPPQEVLAEARANYGKYLARGGPPVKEWQTLMDDRLYRRPHGDICSAIVDFANAGRLGELIRSTKAIDVMAHGRRLDLVFATEGTAHVPTVYAWDEADDSPVKDLPIPDAEKLWGGDALGLVVYGGAAHILHYRDASHPVASMSLGGGGQTCTFSSSTVEQAGVDALEPELCARLDGDSAPASLAFDGPAGMTREDVSNVYGETGLNGSRKIDIANDHHPINIGELAVSSGAGPGCDATFFEQLDQNAAHFASGPQRDKLMELQGVEAGGRYPVQCGNQARFFSYKGTVYFESKPATWPPVDQWNSYHRVTRLRAGQVEDVCHFTFKSTVKLGQSGQDKE